MSIATETALANETGIPYAAVAMSTDYDSWRSDEEPVSWEAVLQVFSENAARVTNLLIKVISRIN
jgi:5'-methylthioadenosine phosphorylase